MKESKLRNNKLRGDRGISKIKINKGKKILNNAYIIVTHFA